MIDHIGIDVSDFEAAKDFYQKALAPLGYSLLMSFPEFAGFGFQSDSGAFVLDLDGRNLEAVCHRAEPSSC